MDTIISLTITTLLLAGAGYAAKNLLPLAQKSTIERIDKSLSATESLPEN